MIYELKNDNLQVKFTTLGGTLTSIKDKTGLEYLWQGNAEYWSGQAPVLFPICGSIRHDKSISESGKNLKMPRHGIIRKKEFQLYEQSDDTITFTIKNDETMKEMFPWDFEVRTQYRLLENTIEVTYCVQNCDKEKMPFFFGGHPGFNCPLEQGKKYDDYEVVFEKEENCSVPTPVTETGLIDMEHRIPFLQGKDNIRLQHSLFEKDAIILDELKSRSLIYKDSEEKHGIRLTFQDFPYLIMWSSANKGPFIALEPWTGLSTCSDEDDMIEHKRNVMFAEPGENKKVSYSITVL